MPARVTLLTDFGTRDGYVGAVKGVIARLSPAVLVDDVSHDISPGDVVGASYALARYWRLYPEGTVHLAVIDPGVGTARRPLGCEAEGRFLVAPDNGLLTRVLENASACRLVELVHVDTPPEVHGGRSATFHARDVFAPTAAQLANGVPLEALGPAVTDALRLKEPRPLREASGGQGVVVATDRFGNLLTNLPGEWVPMARAEVVIAGEIVPVRRTYGEAERGELLALISSDGRLEVSVREGSAAARLRIGRGAPVRLVAL